MWGLCGNSAVCTIVGGGSLEVDLGNGVFGTKIGAFTVGQSLPASSVDYNYVQNIAWSGLSASMPVTGTAATKTRTIRYKATSSSTQIYDLPIVMPGLTVAITYVSGQGSTYHYINRAPQAWSLSATAPPIRTTGLNKQLFLALLNKTGSNVLLGWGNKMLQLAPGGNLIRYDGPVDENGRPSIAPSDFNGAAITSPDGTNYVVGVLEPSTVNPGGYQWHSPGPSAYPTAAAPGGDQVRYTDNGGGPVIGLNHSNGGADYVVLPTGIIKAPSNTSSGGAVLSDPTQAPPIQSSTNTTTNSTSNNTTNNSNAGNVTIINNNLTSTPKDDVAAPVNQAARDALNYDGSGYTGDSQGTPGGDLKGKLDSTRGAINTAFGANSFKLLAAGSIPKVMTYPFTMNLGSWGSFNRTIDFSQMPFPQFRAACLVVMTLGIGMSLMKRLTI